MSKEVGPSSARLHRGSASEVLRLVRGEERAGCGGIGELLRPLSSAASGSGAGIYSLDYGPALSCLEAFGVALAAFKHRPSLT